MSVSPEVRVVSIRTVLCPVDFSPVTIRQVDLAADLCKTFGSRLLLHHNVTDVSVGAGVGWMWHADHADAERSVDLELRTLINRVADGLEVEGHITRGGAAQAVLALSDAVNADLVILGTHGTTGEDHASVTEHMIERSRRTVLALHDSEADATLPRFSADAGEHVTLVPTDLTNESRASVDFAFDLARKMPMRIHLLHVLPHKAAPDDTHNATDTVRQRLNGLVPADLAARAVVHVDDGKTGDAAHSIANLARELSASWIVMGEHTRVPLVRWFRRDTSRAVLHQAPCPVWYVPGRRAR